MFHVVHIRAENFKFVKLQDAVLDFQDAVLVNTQVSEVNHVVHLLGNLFAERGSE